MDADEDASARTTLASERTQLASERTQLAWWRTGLTAIAVALAVGRIVPELSPDSPQWPYSVIGLGFTLYGIALIAYGSARARRIETALHAAGGPPVEDRTLTALTFAGIGLAVATAVLIVVA